MGKCSIRGLLLGKQKIYIRSNELYTGEIHTFAKMYKAEYAAPPLGLLPDHVAIPIVSYLLPVYNLLL